MDIMLKSALHYHNEGLCVIPIIPHQKRPALDWERYHTQCSTIQEIKNWFLKMAYNIGIVHGEVSHNFVSIDIDHNKGIFEDIKEKFPLLFNGRIEQSGSWEGNHIPLRVKELPDFGQDMKHQRPKGNKTWKTNKGIVNIRARFCQTVVPPSIHPSGNRYRFLQKGPITEIDSLTPLISWLDDMIPQNLDPLPLPQPRRDQPRGNDLLDQVQECWRDPIQIFQEFGLTQNGIEVERNGELRILGNGGLLVTEDRQKWYCFTDEFGGGLFEAWGWCRMGSSYDNKKHFRQILLEMAQVAGVDIGRFYREGDEKKTPDPPPSRYWSRQFGEYWSFAR